MNPKLPVKKTLTSSWEYCKNNLKAIGLFSLVNFAFLILGFKIIGGFSSPIFLPWTVLYYIFGTYFFRFYFNRKPYIQISVLFNSLIPSTKILFISVLFLFVMMLLPFVPFFFGMPIENMESYLNFLQQYMQESSFIDLALNLLLVFVSPLILYRPFMAWISSVLGRSGAIKTAYYKTEGNYWEFVLISLVINAPYILGSQLTFFFNVDEALLTALASPLIIFFNVVICKVYEFFNNIEEKKSSL